MTWSPDSPLDTETDEVWDEALDAEDELEPGALGNPEGERSLDHQLVVDEDEVDEAGLRLDDPEAIALLEGDMDDPDGMPTPPPAHDAEEDGWDLDAAETLTAARLEEHSEDLLEDLGGESP